MSRRFRIESRTHRTPWSPEGSGDTYTTKAKAEAAMRTLEPENDDGEAIEYRVVED